MLLQVFNFELKYRFRRPATWIYFAIMFLMSFAAIAWENLTVGGGVGQVKQNAPTVLANMMLILTAFPGFFISSAVMGVPILRDYEHRTGPMLFISRLSKFQYLGGRFAGSFLVLLIIFSGVPLGLMLGSIMPWLDAEKLVAFQAWSYLQPFLIFVLPNLLIGGALFFMGGALSKNMLFVFVQGIVLLALWIMTSTLIAEMDNKNLVALLDPFAINTVGVVSRYWTVVEQNTQLYSLSGLVLGNRLIWTAVALVAMLGTYLGFSFGEIRNPLGFRRKHAQATSSVMPNLTVHIPQVKVQLDTWAQLRQTLGLSGLYFREVVRSVPFLAIVLVGMTILVINSIYFNRMYGTEVYPNTYLVLELIQSFNIFFLIIIVFYSGELIWRERDLRMDQIMHALPVSNHTSLVAKFLAMTGLYVVMLLMLIGCGVLIQTFRGFFHYELGIYFSTLFSDVFIWLLLFTMLSFFVQIIANDKFLGIALMVVFFIFTLVMSEVGLEHRLFRFASASLGRYSDMNAYGHYVVGFSWFNFYWTMLALVLFGLSSLLVIRGTDTVMRTRFKLLKNRMTRQVAILLAAGVVFFVSSGFFIYYNTNILNEYLTTKGRQKRQAAYEKALKQYEYLPQPRIVETSLEVDIFPYRRDYEADGHYILKNKTSNTIAQIHIQQGLDENLRTDEIAFDRQFTLIESRPEFRYYIYELEPALAPGDSVQMDWKVSFQTRGFEESGGSTEVVFNGTFFNNTGFPSIGYNSSVELFSDDDRKKYDLPEKERMLPRTDSIGRQMNLFGDDADHIRFEITISTAEDQIAIAPGYLQQEWTENGRRYFHYEMDKPMANFYSMVSARYEVINEKWTGPNGQELNLEIYYHPGHEYNLDRMMRSMKDALAYYSEQFSPYQYRQMRIMEFPRYAAFAQSFANTVPFSEAIGFVMKIDDEKKDVDMAYYVTAHEMAHQWWGHQVSEARVQGNAMLSESLSQYSALMVMKHHYPPEMMQKFLEYELDRYLSGRASETKKEQPLVKVESQSYIHYRKGSLVFYALQDYIGEDSVNAALRRYVRDWAWREDRYPTTLDLMAYLEAVTPDSLSYVLTDMFETITLYENRAKTAQAKPIGQDRYQLTLEVESIKYRADSLGSEQKVPLRDWIDIGVFAKNQAGEDSLIYLEKHLIDSDHQEIEIELNQQPTKAGIDPINKLIDRNPDDNTIPVQIEKDPQA